MKKFTFYTDFQDFSVNVGDKLKFTVVARQQDLRVYGIDDVDRPELLSVCQALCSDDINDQNYLDAAILNTLPEDITATVLDVSNYFGNVTEITISIDELENM